MPTFQQQQQKIMRLVEKCESVMNNGAEKQTTESVSEGAQILDMADKDSETAATTVFKELKETMFKGAFDDYYTSNRKYQLRGENHFLERTKLNSLS